MLKLWCSDEAWIRLGHSMDCGRGMYFTYKTWRTGYNMTWLVACIVVSCYHSVEMHVRIRIHRHKDDGVNESPLRFCWINVFLSFNCVTDMLNLLADVFNFLKDVDWNESSIYSTIIVARLGNITLDSVFTSHHKCHVIKVQVLLRNLWKVFQLFIFMLIT